MVSSTSGGVWSEAAVHQSLSVCTPGPAASFQIQWYHRSFEANAQFTKIAGGASGTLLFPSVSKNHAGVYKAELKVSNKLTVTSSATIRVKCEFIYRTSISTSH